ncbi:MAG: hypothetical protein HOV81_12325 [Kofleriaceae bacterium]|nr:hypothetical protein [Kofleriaceae bacterium]
MRAFIPFSVLVVLLLVACTKPNPNRCCRDEIDCEEKGIPIGSQCEEGLVCRGNQCIAQPCGSSAACDLAVPYCVDELCAATCTEDAHCPGFEQTDAPYCVDGACAECRDSADCPSPTAAVCDAGSCRACRAHDECASNLCDLDTGTCIAEASIAYAAPNGSAVSACTMAEPCTLTRAVTVLDSSRTTIKLNPGTYSEGIANVSPQLAVYGPATIQGVSLERTNAKLRDLAIIGGLYCSTANSVAPRSNLDAARVDVTLSIDSAVDAFFCNLKLDRVRIQQPATQGVALVVSDHATLQMDRSSIDSVGRCISLSSTSYGEARNSIFRNCRGVNGVIAGEPISFEVFFSTFYNTILRCDRPLLTVTIRDSIFLNEAAGAPADTVLGAGCRNEYSLIKPQSAMVYGVNNTLNADPRFVNAAMGDFHLSAGSPAIDTADPAATETVDFDGTTRPQGPGRDKGAFEYKP